MGHAIKIFLQFFFDRLYCIDWTGFFFGINHKIMNKPPAKDVTQMLRNLNAGSESAPSELIALVYDELRRLAQSYLRHERAGHTLQATALVHEAFLRLVDATEITWQDRTHFFAVAANAMRRILVDYAREKQADKRGGMWRKVSLNEAIGFPSQDNEIDIVALNDALEKLSNFDPQQSKVVELRFFGGLTIEETAQALNISPRTVKREWTVAKAWLHREINN
jgi:RNA polymerase sigma factor (TIGR02999 family)